MSAARERALLRLLADPLERSLAAFLTELQRIIPFDSAVIWASLDEETPEPRAWRRVQPGGALEETELPSGVQPPSPTPLRPDSEVVDHLLVAAQAHREMLFEPGDPPMLVPQVPRGIASELSDPFLLARLHPLRCRRVLRLSFPFSPDKPLDLFLGREGDEPFRQDEIEAAEPLWQALLAAVRRGRQERLSANLSRERSSELSALLEVVRTAGRALEFDELFEELSTAIQTFMDLDAVAVMLDLEGRRTLTFYLVRPLAKQLQEELPRRCHEEFRREAGRDPGFSQVRFHHLPGYDPEGLLLSRSPEIFETLALFRRGEKAGLLAAVAEKGFLSESMSRILTAAAGQASLTIDRLQSGAEAHERQLRAVIDSMSDGVIMTDLDSRVETLNKAAREHLRLFTGMEEPEDLASFGGSDFHDFSAEILAGTRRNASLEVTLPSSRRVLRLTINPLLGPKGAAAGLVVVTSDITEARALQEQIQQAEKLSSLGEMISGVAHELNNPLAAVMGYAQLLQSSRVGPEVHRRLQIVASEAQRCQSIVRNLLSFARKHRPERRLLSMNEVVLSVLSLLAYQLRVEGVEVDARLDDRLPPVHGDFHQLQQVFLNVITNAQQAMKNGEGKKRLLVRSGIAGDRVRVEVQDTGPGIAPEDLPRVFDPFFTTKEVGQGTGLGLSIVFGVVDAHGGKVSARAEPGCGATFIVELPRGGAASDACSVETAEPLPRALPSKSILVVEDEEAVSSLLRDALTDEGHRVDTASDGEKARERLARKDYDLVITDLKMPNEGGRKLYEETVVVRPDLARRFLFATGDVVSGETRLFFERTGLQYLEKPFNVRDLRRLVRQILAEG